MHCQMVAMGVLPLLVNSVSGNVSWEKHETDAFIVINFHE